MLCSGFKFFFVILMNISLCFKYFFPVKLVSGFLTQFSFSYSFLVWGKYRVNGGVDIMGRFG